MTIIDVAGKTDEERDLIRQELQNQLDNSEIGFWAFTEDNTFETGPAEEIPARGTSERRRYLLLNI